jgi:UDP-N-acetylglucosamine 2-epimerase (non-hydrolysing)
MKLTCVAGARPNFVKVAPILRAARERPDVAARLVHTGQHYDERMSGAFFEELALPRPDAWLAAGSGSHAVQTARIMEGFDAELDAHPADCVVVVGDVNSTLACALVAAKRGVCVAHVEAGLRSGDRSMPEEINRILTDRLADLLFTTERTATANLLAEGIERERVHFVGNVMIDTLIAHREKAACSHVLDRLGCTPRAYALCTLHRPGNVDTAGDAENTVRAIEVLASRLPVIFPVHPRTHARLAAFGLLDRLDRAGVRALEPLGYLDFLALMEHARVVFTDSGGTQEETTALGVPCLTFRTTTERPVTVTEGTNRLVGVAPAAVARALDAVLAGSPRESRMPELWDGRAAGRILDVLLRHDAKREPPAVQAASGDGRSCAVR